MVGFNTEFFNTIRQQQSFRGRHDANSAAKALLLAANDRITDPVILRQV